MSVCFQDFESFRHIIIADGPQESWVKPYCEKYQCVYHQTPEVLGGYGGGARNYLFDFIDEYPSDYVLCLDDDNFYMPGLLTAIDQVARKNDNPPLLCFNIYYWCRRGNPKTKTSDPYFILLPDLPPRLGKIDLLNVCFRSDIIGKTRFNDTQSNDYNFIKTVMKSNGISDIVKVDILGGVYLNTDEDEV